MSVNALVTSPWFGLISFAIAILSVAIAIAAYIWPLRTMVPVYSVRSSPVVEKSRRIRGLRVFLGESPIEGTIVLSTISLWNRGVGVIDKNNVASADPLMIRGMAGTKIYDAWLISQRNPANKCSINMQEDGSLMVAFDFLGKGEGLIVGVYRSSLVESANKDVRNYTAELNRELSLVGTIKGVPISVYSEEAGRVTNKFKKGIFGPFKWIERLPIPLQIVSGIVTVVPIFLAMIPIIYPLLVIDGLRNAFAREVDRPFI